MGLQNNSVEIGSIEPQVDSSLELQEYAPAEPGTVPVLGRPASVFRFNRLAATVTGGALALIITIGVIALFIGGLGKKPQLAVGTRADGFQVSSLSLGNLKTDQQLAVGQADHLTVNGQLKVAQGLVLSPSAAPDTAVAGELYYDKTTNAPYYFDGTTYISLAPKNLAPGVSSLGGVAGAIGVGQGLQLVGSQLKVSTDVLQSVASAAALANAGLNAPRVSSLQGLTGDVTFSAGAGIVISGTTITNSGVLGLNAGTGISVTPGPGGTYTITNTGATSTGSVTLGPGAAQDDSSTNSAIDINKLASGNFLNFASNGTPRFVVDQTGKIVTGSIDYSSITGVPATVTSIGGASGVITLGSGLSIVGNTLSAATSTGVLSVVGSTNQVTATDDGNGNITLSLPSTVALTDLQVGNNLTVTNNVRLSTLTGGVVLADGAGNLSSSILDRNGAFFNNTLSVANGGTGAATFTTNGILFGAGTGAIQATNAGTNSVLATDGSGTPSLTQTLPAAVQGNITSTGILTSGSIASGFGTINTTNSISTTAALQGGSLSIAGGNFTVAASTGNVVIAGSATIQGAAGLTIGAAGVNGSVTFTNSSNGHITTLQGLAPNGQDQTITIPASSAASDTVCLLSLANCVGSGSGVTSPSGTQNYLTKYTNAGGTQIGNSLVFDNGTTVGVGTATPNASYVLDVNGATNVSGNFNVGTNLTVTGAARISSLTGGVVKTDGAGNLASGSVALGTDTTGSYVSAIGTLVGLSTSGNGGAGSTPTLTVLYGSSANTAVQGNTSITCASGTGNLSGGGGTITLGVGGSCGAISITNSPTFSGSLTVQGAGGISTGVASSTDGVVNFANAGSAFSGALKVAALGQATTYTLPDPGSVSATICLSTGNCAGAGGGITGSGTSGKLAKFNGTGSIADSTLSESGSTLTASGNVVIQGANSLSVGTSTLANGSVKFFSAAGTHTVSLQAPSSDPASDLVFKLPSAYGSNGSCLQSDGLGGLSFNACTGGAGGGVTSLNGQGGVLTLANASTGSSTITIDNAKADATTKGIATFNATNFTDNGSGLINTIQNIATTSSPVFASVNGTTGLNTGAGAGTQRIDASGNVTAAGLSTAGATNINTTGAANTAIGNATGTFAVTSSALNISAAGALSGVTTLIASGAITAANTGNTINGLIIASGALSGVTGITTNGGYTQTGASANTFSGATTINNTLSVSNGTGVVGTFSGRVVGGDAVANNEFATLQQVNGAVSGAAGNYVANSTSLQSGANFNIGGAGVIGTTLTVGGATTLSNLGAGIVQSSAGGLLSSGAVDRNSATLLSGTLNVANGGTGAATFASKGIVYGNGTGALQVTSSANDSVLVTDASGVPSLQQTLPTAVQGNITSTGALAAGSIASGFGTISTANAITTSAALQGGSLAAGSSGQFAVNGSGVLTVTAGSGIVADFSGRVKGADAVNNDELTTLSQVNAAVAGGVSGAAGNYIANSTSLQSGANFNIGANGQIGGTLTVTGASTLNGTLTVNGAQLTNNGATLNTSVSISDKPSGGSIGSAATTVDVATSFNVNQTTAGQTLTLPSPTITTAGRIVYVSNVGSAQFTLYGVVLTAASSQSYIWNGTAWISSTIDGAGAAGSGVTTVGALNGGTANANGATITSTTIYLQSASASFAGLVDTGTQTFAGAKTFSGAVSVQGAGSFTAAGTGLAVTNDATIGGTLAVTGLITGGTYNGQTISSAASFTGSITAATTIQGTQLISTVATGTAPFTVASTTKVTNLNADLLDGLDSTAFAAASGSGNYIQNTTTQQVGASFNIDGTGVIGSTLSITGATTATGLVTANGGVTVANNSNFTQTGTGTFSTGTGAVSLNGATTVSGATTLNGSQLTNNGSTLFGVGAIGDKPSGGAIGTAAATVDVKTSFSVAQTTAGQTLTLPTPTASATAGRVAYVLNTGSASFTMYGVSIASGAAQTFIYNGTTWISDSVDGAGAGVTTVGSLNGGTANATGATISSNTIYLQSASGSFAGLVDTGTQTFAGAKTFSGAVTVQGSGSFTAAGTGLAVTNNATVGGTLGVSGAASFTAAGTALTVTNNATISGVLSVGTGAGVVATFTGRVSGGDAVANNEFATLQQVNGAVSGAAGNYIANNTSLQSGANFNIDGSGTVGSLTVTNNATIGGSLKLTGSTSFPGSPTEGQVYFRTDTKQLYVYANGKWQADRTTATKIVADGSTSQNPEAADYVVPAAGTSAQTTINAAITALPASGGTVYLREGTYIIDGTIAIPSNVTLTGSGQGTIVKLKNGINASIDAITPASNSMRVNISNFALDGNSSNNTSGTQRGIYFNHVGDTSSAKGGTITGMQILNFRNDGVYLNLSTGNAITDNTFAGNNSAIMVDQSGDNKVADNFIRSGSGNGITLSTNSSKAVVTGNRIVGVTGTAIAVGNAGGALISNNAISSPSGSGISLGSGGGSATVTGNNVDSAGGDGISVGITGNNSISNNTVTLSAGSGISLSCAGASGNQVVGNRVADSGGSGGSSGIYLDGFAGGCVNTYVANNYITDSSGSGYAIQVGGNGTILANNVYSGTGAASINNSGTGTVQAGQLNSSNAFVIQGTSGVALNDGTVTSTATTFNLLTSTVTTLNVADAANTINFAGGSGSTGCTIDGTTGNLTCTGNIVGGSSGTSGFFTRSGTTIQPATAGDNIQTSGNLVTTGSGSVTSAGILNANATGKTALTIADSGAQSSGLTIGGDTNLYRNGAGVLKTDTAFSVGTSLTVATDTTIGGSIKLTGSSSFPGSPTDGQIYYRSDNHQLYVYSTGSAQWTALQSRTATKTVSTSAAGGASTAVASQTPEGADYINTSTTSAQTVINSAIAALPAGGGTVYLMDGTYIIDGTINLASNVTIAGSGANTIIKLKTGINAAIDALSGTNKDRVTVRDLLLEGNKAGNSSGTQRGIVENGGGSATLQGTTILNVTAQNFRDNGINTSNENHTSLNNVTVSGSGATGGMSINGNDVRIVNSTALANTGYGFSLANSNYATITGNTSRGNGTGYDITSANSVTVTGNTSLSDTATGILATTGLLDSSIANNSILTSGGIGIKISGNRNAISNNTINGSATNGIYIETNALNNIVSGNSVYNSGAAGASDGIKIMDGANNTQITNNRITDTAGTGCAINFATSTPATNVYMVDNTYSGTGAASICNIPSTTIQAGQVNSSNALVIQGTSGVALNDGTVTSTATTFNLLTSTVTTLNVADAATSIAFAGGSGSTGCTINGTTGDLTCTGNIVGGTTGTNGFFTRSGTTIQPATAGDNIQTSGNLVTTGSGSVTSAGILNANATGKTALSIADSGAQNSGLTIGGDTNLYRSAAGVLKTDGGLIVAGTGLYKGTSNTTTAFQVQDISSNPVLIADTTNLKVGIGQAPTSSGGTLQIAGPVQATITSSAAYSAGLAGSLVYDTTAGKFYVYDATGAAKKELCNKVDLSCGGTATLQSAYTASTNPEITVDATRGALTIRDASSAIGANLLEVQNNAGSTTYLAVAATGTTVNNLTVAASGSLSLTGGNTASRPASPTEGMLYYDTTTKSLLVYANGKWQADRNTATKIVAMGATSGCSGATPVASANPDAADFVSTSCTAADTTIQAAISALPASGGTVYLEEGTYIISARINIPSNVTIAGSGYSTILKLASTVTTSFDVLGASSGQVRTTVKNLKLDGNKASVTGSQRGIMNNTGDHHVVDHVWATSFRSDGILMSTSGSTITGSTSDSNTGYGFNVGGSSNSTSNNVAESNTDCGFGMTANSSSFSGNTANANSNDGFCGGGGYNSYTGNVATGNSQRGFNITSGNLTITGNTAANNSNTGINTNGSNVTISGNSVTNNGFIGINVAGNTLVTGNQIYDNGGSGSGDALGDNAIGGNNTSFIGNDIKDTAGTSYAISIGGGNTGMYIANNNIGIGSNGVWNSGGPINDNGNGTVYSGQVGNSNTVIMRAPGSVNIALSTAGSGSLSVQGGYYGTQLPTPAQPSANAQGTTGSATYQYKITAVDGIGETAPSTQTSGVTNGFATLDGSHFNRITWNRIPGAVSYKIYRTNVSGGGSPSSLGLVGTVNASVGTMQFDDTGIAATTAAPTINTTGGAFYSGNVLIKAQADNGSAFMVQNSAGTALLTADTTNKLVKLGTGTPTITAATTGGLYVSNSLEVAGQLRFGDATNYIDVDATTHKLSLNGTARNTRTVSLAPEFTNSVLKPDGVDNVGSLTSGIDTTAGAFHNYYNWTTTQGTAQDYDMYVRIPVPRDFSAFPAGGQICYYVWTDDSTPSNSVVSTTFYDTGSTAQTSFTASPTSTNTWQQKCTTNIGGTITVNGNTYVTVQFHFAAAPNQNTRIGEFSFDYLTSF